MRKTRRLSENFMKALLKGGVLNPVLEFVQRDSTLNLEIRNAKKVTIYYRGGILVEFQELPGSQQFGIALKEAYLKGWTLPNWASPLPKLVGSEEGATSLVAILPIIKQAIDRYFYFPRDNREKECQQLIVRENNLGLGKETDYYICDTENVQTGSRFDMVAVKWPFEDKKRRKHYSPALALIELKYGNAAVGDAHGICSHYSKLNEFLGKPGKLKELKDDMVSLFAQKKELGLVNVLHPFAQFDPESRLEYILILANYDAGKSALAAALAELAKLEEENPLPMAQRADIKIATSNFMGYGLFEESIYTLKEFRERFRNQIYAEGLAAD